MEKSCAMPFSLRLNCVKPGGEVASDLPVIPVIVAVVCSRARAAKNKVRKTAHGGDVGPFSHCSAARKYTSSPPWGGTWCLNHSSLSQQVSLYYKPPLQVVAEPCEPASDPTSRPDSACVRARLCVAPFHLQRH